jgi:uncharacterized membrane protein
MAQYLTAYALTAAVFLGLDFVWLSWIAKRFYADRLGQLLRDRPKLGAAVIFYALYVVGIIIFAVGPALEEASAATALIYGSLFGFFAYATYDMTNYATLRGWSLAVTLVDTAWGMCLTGTSASIGYLGTRFILAG